MISANTNMNQNPNTQQPARRRAFTLVELLIVIAIIGVLAAFTVVAVSTIKKKQTISTAQKELAQIESALEDYKAKYGVYPPANQHPPGDYAAPFDRAQFSQLYYELSGVTHDTANQSYTTLDGATTIKETEYKSAYGVGGVVNSTKGSGEDVTSAKNFLSGLKSNQLFDQVTNSGVRTTEIITTVGGPDSTYKPLLASSLNPFRYIYPGTNNPNSYDLWVQLVIKGRTNLICNWSKQVQINSPLP